MKVRIADDELARAIGIGIAVTNKRGLSKDPVVSVLRQLGQYDIFREADDEEEVEVEIPLFPDDYGIARARERFEAENAARDCLSRHDSWNRTVQRARDSEPDPGSL